MRRWVAVAVVLALVASAGCLGGVGATASIDRFEPRVSVSSGFPSAGSDGTETCTYVGPPPGRYGVMGEVVLQRSSASQRSHSASFRLQVRLNDGEWQTARNVSLSATDTERIDLLHIAENEGTVSAGETVTVDARLRRGSRTVAETSRTVDAVEAAGCVDESTG